MAAILRTFGIKKSKHKKLPEDWTDCKAPVIEGITFYCKYLGSTLIDEPSSETLTADAIKRIIAMAKASGKKLQQVSITIKPVGISANDTNTGEQLFDLSIYRISYCSADATYDRVVAFIATNANETHECHAFLTSKRKIAQATALTISQAFSIAFDKWKQIKNNTNNSEKSDNNSIEAQNSNKIAKIEANDENSVNVSQQFTERPLIDLTSDENARPTASWGFDDHFFRLTDNKSSSQQLRNNSNININNFERLHHLVVKEVNESKKNEKFFADDDLFSL